MPYRNIILLAFFSCFIIACSSCSKETIDINLETPERVVSNRNTTLEIEVSEFSHTTDNGNLSVSFNSNFDFSEAVVEPSQVLKFSDGSGNVSALNFDVTSFDGSNGSLSMQFAIGGNNLSGLALLDVQEIIIEDLQIE